MPTDEERRDIAKAIRKTARQSFLGATCFTSLSIERLLNLEVEGILLGVNCYTRESALKLADLIEPEPEKTCEIDRRDPSNPFCKECSYDWNDDWVYCPNCGCKAVG